MFLSNQYFYQINVYIKINGAIPSVLAPGKVVWKVGTNIEIIPRTQRVKLGDNGIAVVLPIRRYQL